MEIKEITKEEGEAIIKSHEPIGLFYYSSPQLGPINRHCAIDNSNGEAITSYFYNVDNCIQWLGEQLNDVQVYCSYTDTEVAELDVFVTCPYCGEVNQERDKTDPGSTYDLECGACDKHYTMYFDVD